MRALRWLLQSLDKPWACYAVIAIAVLLAIPALFSPLVADDHLHALKWGSPLEYRSEPGLSIVDDYFIFVRGDKEAHQRKMESDGVWWMPLDLKVAFWRPVSVATHVVDQVLWPGNSVLMHLQGMLWFLGLLFALSALYHRLLPPRVATLALALYAWDDARGMVLSFVAARNALVAAVFGLCTLLAHDKWRRDGWKLGQYLSPLLLALALLSAEMGLATVGFLVAYALFLDKGSWGRRVARLVPYLVVVVSWQLVYSLRGFGTEASGGYLHPLSEPLQFFVKLLEHAPVLTLAQLTPLNADFWILYPTGARIAVLVLALGVLALVARIAWPRIGQDRTARFWLTSAALSLVPVSVTFPQDRLLVFVGFGAAPALALVFASIVDTPSTSRSVRFTVVALAAFNLALAPLLLPLKCLTTFGLQYTLRQADQSIPQDPTIASKTLVVAWIASEGALGQIRPLRDTKGVPKPAKTRVLAVSVGKLSVARPDEVTLRLRPDDGFFSAELHQMHYTPTRSSQVGTVVSLSDMTVTVTEVTADGRPWTVEFRFRTPLESSDRVWMKGSGLGLVGWTPPRVGETFVESN